MSAKDNSPAISFFSFQDIITSITGIMFLVVIMLVLTVLQQNSSPSRQKSRELQTELSALENELKQLQDSLARFRRQDAEQNKRIEELKKLRLETLPELKQQRIRQLRLVDREIVRLEEANEQILQRQQGQVKLKKEKQLLIQRNQDRLTELQHKIAILDESIRQKEKIYQRFSKVIRFVWNRSTPKQPVLLECSGTEISVNPINSKTPRRTFTNYDECLVHCRTYPPQSTYFILLLKPSAFSYGEKFSRELQKAGYERGREILPDEQILITGELSE